uniref:Uncharacterized protein n=1 Tax=uncultured prokaryote TaxID=198431 RepID=A0A0H5Q7E7_9ZZZZ|nr:hypothetical protein [uncultured prokaryote]
MAITRIQAVFTGLPGMPGVSNFYFQADTQGEAESAHAQVSLFFNSYLAAIVPELTVTVSGEMSVFNEETGVLIEVFSVTPTSYTGTNTGGQVLPYATQFLLKFNTATVVHNRMVRGRVFLPGFSEGDSVSGAVSTAVGADIASKADLYLSGATTGHVVWSRPFAGTETNPAREGSVGLVSSYGYGGQWSVLRSRRP